MGRSVPEAVVEEKEKEIKDTKEYTTSRSNPNTMPDSHPITTISEQNINDGQNIISERQSISSLNTSQINNNYNPHFYGNLPPHLHSKHATQREQLELLVIKRFIKSYFEIVKKILATVFPNALC